MSRNPYWFEQQRARGICYICKMPMKDTDPRKYHRECGILMAKGLTYKEIQEIVKEKYGKR